MTMHNYPDTPLQLIVYDTFDEDKLVYDNFDSCFYLGSNRNFTYLA